MAVYHKPMWLECDIATELEQLVHLDALRYSKNQLSSFITIK